MKNYGESSANIELLLSSADINLSEEKIIKFKKRRKQCLKHLQPSPLENNQKLPDYTPNRFKITVDKKVGRNGEALENIHFGDCVLIDEPIASRVKLFRAKNEVCHNCMVKTSSDQKVTSPFDKEVR